MRRIGVVGGFLLSTLACSNEVTGGGELLVVVTVLVEPSAATLLEGTTQQFIATAKTSSGITVANRAVSWSSSDKTVATVSSGGMVTAVAAGQVIISARVDQASSDVSVTVSRIPVADVTLDPPEATILRGNTKQFTATARDAAGHALPGRVIVFSSDNNTVASVSTSGLVTGNAHGTVNITAQSEGITRSAPVMVIPRPATQVAFATQPQNGSAGQALAPVRVAVLDDLGATVSGASNPITLTLATNPSNATLSGTLTVNAVAGIATFSNVVINKTGTGYTLRATSDQLSQTGSSPFAIAPGAVSQLAIVTQPSSSAQNGIALGQQPVVELRDAGGNVVTRPGITVTVSVSEGQGTVSGNVSATTAADGRASFSGLIITGLAGTYRLGFTTGGAPLVSSDPIQITPGPATQLQVITQPSATAQSGTSFSQQPRVQVTDASGNLVSGAAYIVTASLASGAGSLTGILTATTSASGVAAFTDLAITGQAGGYTIGFNSPPLTGAVSNPVTLTSGPPTQLSMTTQPSGTARSGLVFATQPVIQLRDANGQAVAQAGVPVSATIASGGGTLGGTTTATTNSSGAALFSNLSISGTIGDRTLRFTAASLTPTTSNVISLTPGPPAKMLLTVQPSSVATSGQVLAQQPVVQVQDAAGNAVDQSGIAITASIATGSGASLGGSNGTTASTNGAGQAAFVGLTLTGATGTYTLGFSGGGLAPLVSAQILLVAPPQAVVDRLVITRQPSASAESGEELGTQPRVLALDANNDPVSGASITATVSAPGILTGTITRNTGNDGQATWNNLVLSGPVGSYTLTLSVEDVSVASNTITLSPGAPFQLVITGHPPATVASGVPFLVEVEVRDRSGNRVTTSGTNVTAVLLTDAGSGALGGTIKVNSSNGVASFSNLRITGSGTFRVRFEASGGVAPSTASSPIVVF